MVLLMKTKKIMAFLKTNVKSPKRSPRESPAGPRSQVWPKKPSCLDRHVSTGGAPTRQPPNSVSVAERGSRSCRVSPRFPAASPTRSSLDPEEAVVRQLRQPTAARPRSVSPRVEARRSTHATRRPSPARRAWSCRSGPPRARQKLLKCSPSATCPSLCRKIASFTRFPRHVFYHWGSHLHYK